MNFDEYLKNSFLEFLSKLVVEGQTLWGALAGILILWILYDLFIDNFETTALLTFLLKIGGCILFSGLFLKASIFNNPILTLSLIGVSIVIIVGCRLLSR